MRWSARLGFHESRLVIWHTAWMLDRGERSTHESSMAKVICSEAIWRVVDRSMQILGGLGITDDTIVARLFRDIRPFRIYRRPLRGPPLVDRPPRAARRRRYILTLLQILLIDWLLCSRWGTFDNTKYTVNDNWS